MGRDTVVVRVSPLPSFSTGAEKFICPGDTTTLGDSDLISGGAGPFTFYWQPNYAINDTQSVIPRVHPASSTVYTLYITDSLGCSYSIPVGVYLSGVKVNAGNDRTVCTGCSTQLGGYPVADQGVYPYTYLWTPFDVSDSSLEHPMATPDSTRSYILLATDTKGCTGRDTVRVQTGFSADSCTAAITLPTPGEAFSSYSFVSMDSCNWFKFTLDSTHLFVWCMNPVSDSALDFTNMKLYSGSCGSLSLVSDTVQADSIPILRAGLSGLTPGVYYLKLNKAPGKQSEAIIFMTSSFLLPKNRFGEE